jgi:D-alanyl-D-alanine carboxypeptidase
MINKIQKILMSVEGLIILALVAVLASTTTSYTRSKIESDKIKENLESEIEVKEKEIISAKDEIEFLNEELDFEKERVDDLEDSFRKVTNTVEDLEKLSKTDKELLQKYSKVSFLNEHYIPSDLRDIDDKYVYGDSDMEIHRSVDKFLDDLLEEADDDDLDLLIKSAFRSFGTQAVLKNNYLVTYGSGANTFSADQGYSEHQLGTTVDFTTSTTGTLTTAFENTEEFEWLQDNAYKYGFVLSYPKGNVYYQYEPWHWRFVGKDLARKLHRNNDSFYDLDQREIDEYLLEIFD